MARSRREGARKRGRRRTSKARRSRARRPAATRRGTGAGLWRTPSLRGWIAAGVLAAASLALLAVPGAGPAARRAAGVLLGIVTEARYAEARHALTAELAARYDISFDLAREIEEAALAERIDPELAFRLVYVESRFHERAVSPAGALGLTQLMPATAAWLQPGVTRQEIFDRGTNLRLGFRYLRMLLQTYDGRIEEALHAYNRGPGTVDRIRAAGGDPANGYADLILRPRAGAAYSGSGLLPGIAPHAADE